MPMPNLRDECRQHHNCIITDTMLKSLRPNSLQRFARSFQYTFELDEQQQSVLAILPGSTSATVIQNPDHYLKKHTLKFEFSEMFSSELLSRVKRDYDYVNKIANDKEPIRLEDSPCGSKELMEHLATGGKRWRRALMGVSITGALSERPSVRGGFALALSDNRT